MQKRIMIDQQVSYPKKQTVNNWLFQRHKVLIAYCELAGITPIEQQENALPRNLYVKHFCQILMDYVCAGHFEIFAKIIQGNQASSPNNQDHLTQSTSYQQGNNLHQIYPKLLISTDLALLFNDKYAEKLTEEHCTTFDKHLSALGKQLELRFELEDRLINTYIN